MHVRMPHNPLWRMPPEKKHSRNPVYVVFLSASRKINEAYIKCDYSSFCCLKSWSTDWLQFFILWCNMSTGKWAVFTCQKDAYRHLLLKKFLLLHMNCYKEHIPTRCQYPILRISHWSVHVNIGTERWCCAFPWHLKKRMIASIWLLDNWTRSFTLISGLTLLLQWESYMVWHKYW